MSSQQTAGSPHFVMVSLFGALGVLRPRIQDLGWRDRGIAEDAYDHVRIEDDTHHAGHWFRFNRRMLSGSMEPPSDGSLMRWILAVSMGAEMLWDRFEGTIKAVSAMDSSVKTTESLP
jgi:hypothetical protein